MSLSGGKGLRPVYDDKGVFHGNEVVPTAVTASGSDEDRSAVAEAIIDALAPAPKDHLEAWIAELSVIAPSRADDGMTATLKLEAYARRLEDYPADMVRHVLLGKSWRFFPSWFELEQDLQAMRRERDAMLSACLRSKQTAQPQEEKEDRVSAKRAAEIMAEAGFSPKRFGGDA